jgi:RNA polymerase sigma-70 factor (ECF subfamily)
MSPDNSSDESLVQQIQSGDKDAFLTLYNRYLKKVYNRVKSRIPVSDAEDVTQEIFVAVVRSLDKFEGRAKFNTWLYSIVNHQIADFYRRHYRRGDNQSVSLDNDNGLQIADDDADMDIDASVIVQRVLNDLPENYQEVILMRFSDGLTFAEIAEQRGQTLEATKSLYRRAIQKVVSAVNG